MNINTDNTNARSNITEKLDDFKKDITLAAKGFENKLDCELKSIQLINTVITPVSAGSSSYNRHGIVLRTTLLLIDQGGGKTEFRYNGNTAAELLPIAFDRATSNFIDFLHQKARDAEVC